MLSFVRFHLLLVALCPLPLFVRGVPYRMRYDLLPHTQPPVPTAAAAIATDTTPTPGPLAAASPSESPVSASVVDPPSPSPDGQAASTDMGPASASSLDFASPSATASALDSASDSASEATVSTAGPDPIMFLPPDGPLPIAVLGPASTSVPSDSSSQAQLSASTSSAGISVNSESAIISQASASTSQASAASTATGTSTTSQLATSTSMSATAAPPPPPSPSPSQLPPSSSAPSSTLVPPAGPLMMAYYPDWAAPAFPPEKIDFGRFDWIDYAFAVPDDNFNLTWDGSDDAPDLLNRLVSAAHQSGTKVKLSVGGWTGSRYFSTAMSTPAGQQALASAIQGAYAQFDLDGIDIDWEYPAQQGAGGNAVSPADTANFLAFLRLLRATLPPAARISAAAQTAPFAGAEGVPESDVSAFAEVLDWVLIMNYDAFGSSATPGPNAPLSDACHNSTQPGANAAAALAAWSAAGFPASQLVLGVPSYGYISRSTATRLRARNMDVDSTDMRARRSGRRKGRRAAKKTLLDVFRPRQVAEWTAAIPQAQGVQDENVQDDSVPDAELDAAPSAPAAIMAKNEDGGTDDGQIQFRDLVAQGILQYAPEGTEPGTSTTNTNTTARTSSTNGTSDSPPTWFSASNGRQIRSLYAGWGGFARAWDACSGTPFLHSAGAEQVVAYDDPLSLAVKADWARAAGMLGVNMFDVSGDTDQWDLVDAVRAALGAAS